MKDYISKSVLMDELIHCDGLGRKSLEAVIKTINELPTLDETEVIHKAFERVLQRLEENKDWLMKDFVLANRAEMVKKDALSRINQLDGAIKIVKEECGISE